MRVGKLGLCSRSLMLCSSPRQSMSSLSGPLQVVPDIDDQVANPENPQEVGFPTFLSMELLFCAPKSLCNGKRWLRSVAPEPVRGGG